VLNITYYCYVVIWWLFLALAAGVAVSGSRFWDGCFWLSLPGWLFLAPAAGVAVAGFRFWGGSFWLSLLGWLFLALAFGVAVAGFWSSCRGRRAASAPRCVCVCVCVCHTKVIVFCCVWQSFSMALFMENICVCVHCFGYNCVVALLFWCCATSLFVVVNV
jgi:hypothetical protein